MKHIQYSSKKIIKNGMHALSGVSNQYNSYIRNKVSGIRNSILDARCWIKYVIPEGSLQLQVQYWFWMLNARYSLPETYNFFSQRRNDDTLLFFITFSCFAWLLPFLRGLNDILIIAMFRSSNIQVNLWGTKFWKSGLKFSYIK